MPGIAYSLNVATLAVWASVAGAGIYGVADSGPVRPALESSVHDKEEAGEGPVIDLLPESGSPEPGPAAEVAASEELLTPELEVAPPVESPPELLPAAELAPLPEVPELPDLPPIPPAPATPKTESTPRPRTVAKSANSPGSRASTSGRTGQGSGNGNGKGEGVGNGTAPGTGQGGGGSSRIRRSDIAKPVYPSSCREAGQTGTVYIVFTVDPAGNVASARVDRGTPYPALNDSALNAVRRSKFPRGPVAETRRVPIVFNLHD